jgi:hypothetical protein
MILTFIIAVCALQLCLYLVSDKLSFGYGKHIVSLLIIIGHLAVFPAFFMPVPTNEFRCGMVAVGVYGAFWVYGVGSSLIVWTGYVLMHKIITNRFKKC